MIQPDDSVFPNNAVALIKSRFQLLDSDLFVTGRPLRDSDLPQSIGVFAIMWQPREDSYEMRGGPAGRSEPTLQRYLVSVQAFVKNMDQEAGISTHAVLSKLIRTTLYRDEPLRVALGSLSWTNGSCTERTQRWGISQQRYVSNEIRGEWLFLSSLELWLETETV